MDGGEIGGSQNSRRLTAAVPLAIALVACCSAPAQTIIPISSIHRLDSRKIAAAREVAVEGVVTESAFLPWGLTLEDGSDGIFVAINRGSPVPAASVGDRVRVIGTVAPGEFAPVINAKSVSIQGRGALPRPHRLTENELSGGALDNRFVEIRGTVRAVAGGQIAEKPAAFLVMDTQDGSSDTVELVLPNPSENPIRYVDAAVSARGVVSVIYNRKRQALGLKLIVNSARDIRVLRAPAADPFALEPTAIADLLQWRVRRDWSHRVRVSGTLTLQRKGEFVILQDGASAIRVETESQEAIAAGTRVEATGFVSAGGYSATLRDAVIRATGAGSPIPPAPRRARQLLAGDEDDLLVTTSARVLDTGRIAGRAVLTLEDGGIEFEAEAPGRAEHALRGIPAGATVEVTGICRIIADTLRSPRSFQLLLRSERDVRVLDSGPVLTVSRVIAACGVAVAIALMCGLWVILLRGRVGAQTEWIRQSLAREHCTATLMARRSAVLERVGRNEPLDAILDAIGRLADAHIPDANPSVRILSDEPSSLAAPAESAAVAVASSSGRIRARLTLARNPRSEAEKEALRVCRECLALAVEHRDLHERLLEQSLSDPLTHLPNRRSLDDRLRRALDEAARENEPLAVLALDLDSFKQVNDTLGHAAGDTVLQEISRRFVAVVRRTDLVARVGGDEFIVLLPRIGDRSRALEIANRLAEAASSEMEINGMRISPSISIGAAFYPEDGDRPETLRHAADLRMYERKMRIEQASPAEVPA